MTKLDYDEVFQFMKDFGISILTYNKELIIDERTNTYASISECENIEDVEMRVVFNMCRPIGKGLELKDAKRLLEKFNKYFGTVLTREDMLLMYGELCYRHKFEEFKEFIRRGFPVEELKENKNGE